MCRLATTSLDFAVFIRFRGGFEEKKVDFGPKLQILKWRSSTCDARSWPPPLILWLIFCVVVPHTHR